MKKGELFKALIRDGGPQKRYGYVTSEPVYDIPADLLSIVPDEGTRGTDLFKAAKEKFGYYGDESDEACKTLVNN
jgi:hypothetical protein